MKIFQFIMLVMSRLHKGQSWYETPAFEEFGDTMADCVRIKDVSSTDCTTTVGETEWRTLDGTCNNLANPRQGAANTPLRRIIAANYPKGNIPLGHPSAGLSKVVPTPQEISYRLFESAADPGNVKHVSGLHMAFGQFLDHDLSLTPTDKSVNCAKPRCDKNDDFIYPCLPIRQSRWLISSKCSKFTRSKAICNENLGETREQVNVLSSYIDGSMIYSVSEEKLMALRTNAGDGKLRVTVDNLLPFDPHATNDCLTRGGCFLAGDSRVDEHIGLASFHTLFVREHNRIAGQLAELHPDWTGEHIFNTARSIIGAILQHVTYNEYLPTLADLDPYAGYKDTVDSSIFNSFSTAAFRFGHSQIRGAWGQLNANFDPVEPDIPLRRTFFNNTKLLDNGIEPTFFGLLANESADVDLNFPLSVIEHLFVPMEVRKGLENLAAINIQRGRDHGISDYNSWREECGLSKRWVYIKEFKEISWNNRFKLTWAYGDRNIEYIDLFSAGLSENHLEGKIIGPTFSCIIKRQFENIRDGDRFWFENEDSGSFTREQISEIKRVTLARVLCDNLQGIVSIQRNVFKAFTENNRRHVCEDLPRMDLSKW